MMKNLRGGHTGADRERVAAGFRVTLELDGSPATILCGYPLTLSRRQGFAYGGIELQELHFARQAERPLLDGDIQAWVSQRKAESMLTLAEGTPWDALAVREIEVILDEPPPGWGDEQASRDTWLPEFISAVMGGRLSQGAVASLCAYALSKPAEASIRSPQLNWYRRNPGDGFSNPDFSLTAELRGILDVWVPTISDRPSDYEFRVEDKWDPVQRCVRQLRIVVLNGWTLYLWFPREFDSEEAQSVWDEESQQGRYQGIAPFRRYPEPDRASVIHKPDAASTLQERLLSARAHEVREHIEICIFHASASSLAWSRRLSNALDQGDNIFDQVAIDDLQSDLASIGSALSLADVSIRKSILRTREEAVVADLRSWSDVYETLLTKVSTAQQAQLESSQNLAGLAIGVQSHARESQSRALALITGLVLLPSLVVGVFGANLTSLAPDTRASWLELVLWTVAATLAALNLLAGAFQKTSRFVIAATPILLWVGVIIVSFRLPDMTFQWVLAAAITTATSGANLLSLRRA